MDIPTVFPRPDNDEHDRGEKNTEKMQKKKSGLLEPFSICDGTRVRVIMPSRRDSAVPAEKTDECHVLSDFR